MESSEGSLDVLPVQCLCEFLLHDVPPEGFVCDEDDDKSEQQKKKQVIFLFLFNSLFLIKILKLLKFRRKTSLNRSTREPTLSGPFREITDLGSKNGRSFGTQIK